MGQRQTRIAATGLDQPGSQTLFIIQQNLEHMLWCKTLVPLTQGQ